MEWQPIETAPKDGYFLVYCPETLPEYEDYDEGGIWYRELINEPTPEFIAVAMRNWDWNGEIHAFAPFHFAEEGKPTHWMPLPPPPQVQS